MTSAQARVLLLNHTAVLGGAELALLRFIDDLRGREVQPSLSAVIMEDGPLVRELRLRGLPVTVLPLSTHAAVVTRHTVKNPTALLAAFTGACRLLISLRQLLHQQSPDIVQSGSMKAHLLGALATFGRKERLVWYLHDLLAPPYLSRPVAWVIRTLSKIPDAVFVNSRATSNTVPRDTVLAYPGYTPAQAGHHGRFRNRAASQLGPFVLLGRISPTKGQHEFVEAAAVVRRRHPEAHFVIAGSPVFGAEEYAASLSAAIEELRMTEVVAMPGFIQDPTSLLDQAVALVHASPVPEPFGQVILEAAIRGVPVIATRAGGAPEILTDEQGQEHGLLVPPGDVAALAQAMMHILDDPQASGSRAERAQAFAVRMFPISNTVRDVVETWERLLTPRRPRRRFTQGSRGPFRWPRLDLTNPRRRDSRQ